MIGCPLSLAAGAETRSNDGDRAGCLRSQASQQASVAASPAVAASLAAGALGCALEEAALLVEVAGQPLIEGVGGKDVLQPVESNGPGFEPFNGVLVEGLGAGKGASQAFPRVGDGGGGLGHERARDDDEDDPPGLLVPAG
jgi:hypothetical protein